MKINHFRIFLHALRSALLIVAGFIAYEILIQFEKELNLNFGEKKLYKLVFIFLFDLCILYGAYLAFNIEL